MRETFQWVSFNRRFAWFLSIFFSVLENCYLDNELISCPDDRLCIFRFEQNSLQQGCTSNTSLMGLQIETTIDIQTLQEELLIIFICNYDRCNSEQNFQQIKFFIEQYSHLTVIRRTVNKTRLIEITTFTNTNTDSTHFQQTTTTTIITTTTTNNSSKSSVYRCYLIINIVGILCFILYFKYCLLSVTSKSVLFIFE